MNEGRRKSERRMGEIEGSHGGRKDVKGQRKNKERKGKGSNQVFCGVLVL